MYTNAGQVVLSL